MIGILRYRPRKKKYDWVCWGFSLQLLEYKVGIPWSGLGCHPLTTEWEANGLILPPRAVSNGRVGPSLPVAPQATWTASDLPLGLLLSSWGMSNWDSPKCLNTRIEINVPSLLATLTIHYSKHLPKVKWMFVYPHEIYIKTCWWKKP